jgi:hypothetical protein
MRVRRESGAGVPGSSRATWFWVRLPSRRESGKKERAGPVWARRDGNEARRERFDGSTLGTYGGHFSGSPVWRERGRDRQKGARWPPYAPFCSDDVLTDAPCPHGRRND